MPPDPGSRIISDRYELGELVGSGGMGEVYAARDLKLDRAVALKFLRPDMAAQPDIRSRFEAEARAAGRLSHPNVVGVFDTDEDEGRPFIVMELLSGRTLADEAAAGPATEERVREVGKQMLSALGASHAQGVLHRDLKPGNVLLAQDGTVKVGDFGVAKMAEGMHLTQAGILLGTPAYLAPERVAGEPASQATDLYSVGVILYELLAGRKPFDADTPLGLMRAIQEDPVPALAELRPDVDPGLSRIIEKAMSKNPATRYASAEEMLADLEAPAPAVMPDATEVARPPVAATRVLESPGAAEGARTEPTLVSRPVPRRSGLRAWERLDRRSRIGVAIGAALIVLSLVLFRINTSEVPAGDAGGGTPAAETSDGELPAQLEDALQELEEAVE